MLIILRLISISVAGFANLISINAWGAGVNQLNKIEEMAGCRSDTGFSPIGQLAVSLPMVVLGASGGSDNFDEAREAAINQLPPHSKIAFEAANKEFHLKLLSYLLQKPGKLSSEDSKTVKAVSGFASLLSGGLTSPVNLVGSAIQMGTTAMSVNNRQKRVDNTHKAFSPKRLERVSEIFALNFATKFSTPLEHLSPKAAEQFAEDCAYIAYHYVSSGEVNKFMEDRKRVLGRDLTQQEMVEDIGAFLLKRVIEDIPKLDKSKDSFLSKIKSLANRKERYLTRTQPIRELKGSELVELASDRNGFNFQPTKTVAQPPLFVLQLLK